MAEAAGIESRAAALSQNQEAVIAQQIAQTLPDIVRAAASPFEHVGQFTVLNGAQGVTSALSEIIQQAGALAGVARKTITPLLMDTIKDESGTSPKPVAPAKAAPTAKAVAAPKAE